MSDGSDSARWAYEHGGGAYRSTEDQALAAGAPVIAIHHAFARKLTELNDRELRLGGTIPALLDPRDILQHVEALAAGMFMAGEVPSMDLVNALGAQVLALGLAVARVEDGRFDTGGGGCMSDGMNRYEALAEHLRLLADAIDTTLGDDDSVSWADDLRGTAEAIGVLAQQHRGAVEALQKLADPDGWDRYERPHRHTVRFAREQLERLGIAAPGGR